MAWWLDPLDPKVHGPHDCGRDHATERVLDWAWASLLVYDGISWTVSRTPSDGDGVMVTTLVVDEFNGRKGLITYPKTIAKEPSFTVPSTILGAIDWRADIAAFEREMGPGGGEPPRGPRLRWVGYEENGRARRYVLVPCTRKGCDRFVAVDMERPGYRPTGEVVLPFGSADEELPVFASMPVTCDDSLRTECESRPPCRLRNSRALTDALSAEGLRWTAWNGNATEGVVLVQPDDGYAMGSNGVSSKRTCRTVGVIVYGDGFDLRRVETPSERALEVLEVALRRRVVWTSPAALIDSSDPPISHLRRRLPDGAFDRYARQITDALQTLCRGPGTRTELPE